MAEEITLALHKSIENVTKICSSTASDVISSQSKLEEVLQALESRLHSLKDQAERVEKSRIGEAISVIESYKSRVNKLKDRVNKVAKRVEKIEEATSKLSA